MERKGKMCIHMALAKKKKSQQRSVVKMKRKEQDEAGSECYSQSMMGTHIHYFQHPHREEFTSQTVALFDTGSTLPLPQFAL